MTSIKADPNRANAGKTSGAIETREAEEAGLLSFVRTVFLRAIAIYFLFSALQYWLSLIGYYEGPNNRFDTMAPHWQAMTAILAVGQPIAALGLWGLFSWGLVVWFLVAVAEIAMFNWFSTSFGERPQLVIFHFSMLAAFLIYSLASRFITNKR